MRNSDDNVLLHRDRDQERSGHTHQGDKIQRANFHIGTGVVPSHPEEPDTSVHLYAGRVGARSGVKAAQLIGDLWPRRVSNSARVLRCHTLIKLS